MAVYFHPACLEHLKGINHPEKPERLESIRRHLQEADVWRQVQLKEPRAAEREWIEQNHSGFYIDMVQKACRQGPVSLDQGDTMVTPGSWEAALRAAGAALDGVDDLLSGRARAAFCAVRPPGHHAERDTAMGFCLFNNVAIAAHYALRHHGLSRVFILDWDVHHGNGTQNSFLDRSDVFYCSLHQWPLYPGTGRTEERGRWAGEGYTLNIPIPPFEGDLAYLTELRTQVLPALRRYKPELLIISAGFDAHEGDPLASMQLSTEGFARMTRLVRQEMDNLVPGRILSVLEGGYHLRHLAESVMAHLKELVASR
ncbi:MAG: histone deacetylase [Calditrichaeota bacterium]|nr:MAG: histone deacetylase [Calditrichota bacterium]